MNIARTLIIRIDSRIIICRNNILFIKKINIKKDLFHIFYDKCINSQLKKHIFLHPILKNSDLILNIEGEKKTNLIFYLFFKCAVSNTALLNIDIKKLSSNQLKLYKYLTFNDEYMKDLNNNFSLTYIKFILTIQSQAKHEDVEICEKLKNIYKNYKKGIIPYNYKFYRIHSTFCTKNANNLIKDFQQEYRVIINNLKNGIFDNCIKNRILYPEISLYFDFCLYKNFDILIYDFKNIDDSNFNTIKERKVIKKIKENFLK